MASPVYSLTTLVEEAQAAINDITGNRMLDDAAILRFLLRRVVTRNHSVTLYDIGNNYFAYTGGAVFPMILNSTAPFSGEDDVEYTVNEHGPSVVVTTGAATVDSISVTGALIDYDEALADMLVHLATNRSTEVAESMGGGSYSPSGVRAELIAMAEARRGPRGA